MIYSIAGARKKQHLKLIAVYAECNLIITKGGQKVLSLDIFDQNFVQKFIKIDSKLRP